MDSHIPGSTDVITLS